MTDQVTKLLYCCDKRLICLRLEQHFLAVFYLSK